MRRQGPRAHRVWTPHLRALTGLCTTLALLLVTAPSAAQAGVAGHVRVAINSHPDFSNDNVTANRNKYVILQATQTKLLHKLKAANPHLKVLVYKNLTDSRSDAHHGPYSSGVSYQEANSEHPEWFLKNSSGQRITYNENSHLYAMDVGSPSYQHRWAANVISQLKRKGWDGVFMDDVNATMRYHYDPAKIAKYPTDVAWQQATKSALSYIGPQIRSHGKLAIANIGSWGSFTPVGNSWLKYLSGGMQEMFGKWDNTPNSGYASEDRWQADMSSLEYAQRHGKEYLAVTHSASDDRAAARYGWASMLLGAKGKAAFALAGDYTRETWFPEYSYKLGHPTGPDSVASNGVHRRAFYKGLVLVNPTSSAQSVKFGGSYSGSGLSDKTGTTMGPHTGLVLKRDAPRRSSHKKILP